MVQATFCVAVINRVEDVDLMDWKDDKGWNITSILWTGGTEPSPTSVFLLATDKHD